MIFMSLWKKENSKKVIHSCWLCPQKTLHYGLNLCPPYVWKKKFQYHMVFSRTFSYLCKVGISLWESGLKTYDKKSWLYLVHLDIAKPSSYVIRKTFCGESNTQRDITFNKHCSLKNPNENRPNLVKRRSFCLQSFWVYRNDFFLPL